jgi:hypothetical protein
MRNDYNKNISRSNTTCNSNISIGSTRNRSNSNRSNSNSSNSSITGVLVVPPICSSERDATPSFFRKTKCLRISRNRTFAVARVTHEGRARLARQRVPDLFLENKRNAASCSV